MKKLLLALLTFVLVLPVVVKADLVHLNSFSNDNVTVDDEVVVNTIINFEYFPHQIEYTYDQNMLSITKDKISTPSSSDTVKIENGKITINLLEHGPIEEYGMPYVTLRFTALKAGTTEIEPFLGDGYLAVPGKHKINIKAKDVAEPVEQEEKPNEEVKEEPKEETKEVTKEEKKCDNLFLYISLGLNVLLLILLVVVLLKKNSKKKQEEA